MITQYSHGHYYRHHPSYYQQPLPSAAVLAELSKPVIISLTYSLKDGVEVQYNDPPSVEFDTAEAHFRLEDKKLTCTMKVECPTVEKARAAVEPVVRAWEVGAQLCGHPRGMRFEYEDAEVVYRNPPPPGVSNASLHAVLDDAVGRCTVTVTRSFSEYPAPPTSFKLTPEAAALWDRYQGQLDNREPLQAAAYYVLDWIEQRAREELPSIAKKRDAAAKWLGVTEAVLDRLGKLTSTRGTPTDARKAPRGGQFVPLASEEIEWIRAAVRHLIRRVGCPAGDRASLPELTLSDSPPL